MEQGEAGERHERADHHEPSLAVNMSATLVGSVPGLEQPDELIRDDEPQPGERHDVDREGDVEGEAPAPAQEILGRRLR